MQDKRFRNIKKISNLSTKPGFTLVEIMTVVGITVLIFLIVYNTFLISHQSFIVGDQRLELIQNGRIILDRLTRELRQSVEIVTPLPAIKDDPAFEPPSEILFQDGHDLEIIQYLKYYVENNLLKRQRIVYYFATEPDSYVYWDTKDEFGQSPLFSVTDERVIAEYISDILYYGENITSIEVYLNKQNSNLHLLTSIWGRNKR